MPSKVLREPNPERFLSNPEDLNAFEGTAYVFDGPADFHDRIDDESLAAFDGGDEDTGSAEEDTGTD